MITVYSEEYKFVYVHGSCQWKKNEKKEWLMEFINLSTALEQLNREFYQHQSIPKNGF